MVRRKDDSVVEEMTLQYDIAGRQTTLLNGAGLNELTTFDAASQIVSLINQNALGVTTQRHTFTYDGVGNRTKVQRSDGQVTTYAYDAKNRLTQDATTGANAHTYDYTYDGNDNRLTSSENGLTTYTYDAANRLVTSVDASGMTTYSFDNNGNMTNVLEPASVRTTLTYDKENRLSVHQDATDRVTYTYDGDGLKRTEVTATGTTTIVWDGDEYLGEV